MNILEQVQIGSQIFDVSNWESVKLEFTQNDFVVLYNGPEQVHEHKMESTTRVNLRTRYGNFLYREKHYSHRQMDQEKLLESPL